MEIFYMPQENFNFFQKLFSDNSRLFYFSFHPPALPALLWPRQNFIFKSRAFSIETPPLANRNHVEFSCPSQAVSPSAPCPPYIPASPRQAVLTPASIFAFADNSRWFKLEL